MSVEIPGEAGTAPRRGDVNRREYERNARVADALQKCMSPPSEILDKTLTATAVEEYYKCAIHACGLVPALPSYNVGALFPPVHARASLFTSCLRRYPGTQGAAGQKPCHRRPEAERYVRPPRKRPQGSLGGHSCVQRAPGEGSEDGHQPDSGPHRAARLQRASLLALDFACAHPRAHAAAQGIDLAAAKLARMQQALDGLESEDVITAFVSDKASRKVREGAEKGNLVALQQVEDERKTWPPYMVMSSWDFADHRGNTAVHLAAKHGHVECLEFLLMRGAQPSLVNAQGHSALHIAATYDVAKLLLKHGADPVVLDKMGRTPYDVHRANRMGGARSVGGKLVLDAFAVGHQQVTGPDARSILRERNMSPEDKAARAAAQKAAEDAQVAARLEAERIALAKSSYNQGLGALVLKEFDTAVSSFVTCLQNDPGHPGATLKLAKMAASGEGNAAVELERLQADTDAAEAAVAKAAAAASAVMDTAAAISEIRELQSEPEVLLMVSPSRPSLDGRAAAPIVTGASLSMRPVLHSVLALPLSPMVATLSQGRQSSFVPTPPESRPSNSVPTLSPRAPPAAPSVSCCPLRLSTIVLFLH